MNKNTDPVRKIVSREFSYWTDWHARNHQGSVILTLDCGHTKRLKISQEPRKFARCSACKS